ncbi:MAG TPA: c-type cytochrome domain-containing protein [Gammaproteobacteria bacterium]
MRQTINLFSLGIILIALTGCGNSSTSKVSFSKQVYPILTSRCLSCHTSEGEGYKKSGLSMETYDALMKGTKFGPVIVPGNPLSSSLVLLIEGKADPAITMPHGSLQILPQQERDTIKQWIQQGAENN